MGVGTPANILENIALGIDMFDCVMPTRNARNGMLFTTQGIINIRNEKWKDDFSPIDENLGGYASSFYSKAYLRHLISSKEILGAQIASIHNLSFYLWLVRQAREHIIAGDFVETVDSLNASTDDRELFCFCHRLPSLFSFRATFNPILMPRFGTRRIAAI